MRQAKSPAPGHGNGTASAQTLQAGASETPAADSAISPYEMIAVSAYFNSERRGFAPGNELADWFQAEAWFKSRSNWDS